MDIDIRPVPVDKLVTWPTDELESRRAQLELLLEEFRRKVETLQTDLEDAQRIFVFIQVELDQVKLSVRLIQEDIVRVVCPSCNGSGMKGANVLTGQVSQGSAFQSVGKPHVTSAVIAEHLRCPGCKGQRWVIMDRFKG